MTTKVCNSPWMGRTISPGAGWSSPVGILVQRGMFAVYLLRQGAPSAHLCSLMLTTQPHGKSSLVGRNDQLHTEGCPGGPESCNQSRANRKLSESSPGPWLFLHLQPPSPPSRSPLGRPRANFQTVPTWAPTQALSRPPALTWRKKGERYQMFRFENAFAGEARRTLRHPQPARVCIHHRQQTRLSHLQIKRLL